MRLRMVIHLVNRPLSVVSEHVLGDAVVTVTAPSFPLRQ